MDNNNKPLLLDNVEHHDLRISAGRSIAQAGAVNQVRVFPNEFAEVQREYPIFFRRDDHGAFYAVALLGFDRDENLFLDGDAWNARYIPAILQRGPFMLGVRDASGGDDAAASAPVVLIDPGHPDLSRSEGEPLFLPHGGNTPVLERHIQVLRTIHQGNGMNDAVFAAFLDAGIVAPLNVEVRIDEEAKQYKIPDLFSVSSAALARLDGVVLARLNATGYLAMAFFVAGSAGNLQHLIALKNRKRRES